MALAPHLVATPRQEVATPRLEVVTLRVEVVITALLVAPLVEVDPHQPLSQVRDVID